MSRLLAGGFWILLSLVVVLAPMYLMMVRPTPAGRGFWVELSIAFGFVGSTQMAVQFVLIVAHPAILMIRTPALVRMLNPFGGSWPSVPTASSSASRPSATSRTTYAASP